MSDSKSFIEVQLPVSKLSKESYKERKAGQSQTLTGLGKWWGRKPLILVRATILGLLMPASEDPKKDREIYLKILMMDDIGLWLRKNKPIDKNDVFALLTDKERTLVFKDSPKLDYKPNFNEFETQLSITFLEDNGEPKEKKIDRYKKLKERFKKPIDLAQYLAFSKLSYDKKLTYCLRPEETELTDEREWAVINAHLKTSAKNLRELIRELGESRFGKVPTVGDCFSGGGSIPFEAARIGCDVYASDLNPLAGLLTWAGLNILSLPDDEISKLKDFQEKVFDEVVKQIDEWGIETNEKGWRAKYYLYCNETLCPECNTLVPLAPSWVISERNKTIAFLQFNDENKNFDILIKNDVSADEMKAANTSGTVKGNEMVCPHCKATHPITILRNDRQDENGNMKYGLRRWEKNEFIPRKDDVYQERLYCIKYVEKYEHKTWDEFIKKPAPATDASYGKVYYVAPDENDLKREQKVIELLKERFDEWQEKGFIPDSPIEDGYNTSQLIRERGWSYWHQLFNPRQLLYHGILLKKAETFYSNKIDLVLTLLNENNVSNWDSKLCYWQQQVDKGTSAFYNQALNAVYNVPSRTLSSIYNLWNISIISGNFPINLLQNEIKGLPFNLKGGQNKVEGNHNEIEIGQNDAKEGQNTSKGYDINLEGRQNEIKGDASEVKIELKDARTIENNCEIWITDPPYADAVNYHELSEFFLAWDKKMLKKIFPDWYTDSKRILAVQGKGESFNQSMISIYSNLAKNMPDDGMQVVMFTHQDTSVWADLTMILWSAGLEVFAAWTIATETESGGLKEGNYVKGTVLLVLRKHLGENEAFMHLLMPEIEEEVKSQIDSMKTIDDKDDPNFNDGDYLIAANVSALKVLTSYTKIAGMDIDYELKKERKSGDLSEIEKTILNARQIASNYLVPRGFDSFTWKMLEAVERFYIKGIDLEKDGIYQISAYQEMARGFGVHDYKNLLSSTKANNVRLKTGNEFGGRNLNSDDKFSQTLLRNVLMALHLSVKNEEPKAGLNWLTNELEDFWGKKSSILAILEFITSTKFIENMKHWHPEAEQAGMLIELIKGHGV